MLVNNKRLNILNIGGEVSLMPGVNNLPQYDARAWDEIQKKYPKVKQLMDDDLLVVIDGSDDDRAPAPAQQGNAPRSTGGQDLTRFREKDAIRIVKECTDDGLLTQWHEAEERPNVVRAIEDQFAALARAGEPR